MLNDRMCMIKKQIEIENLQDVNENLFKDLEELQDENENLLKDLKELSLENSTLKEKIEEKDLKIAELYLKLSKAEGLLNKYMNHVKMNLGREL